jgi:diguanylate cyclase (GGDEF)-like protein
LPTLFIGLVAWARGLLSGLSEDQVLLVNYIPYLLCAVCVVLAYQFNRSRFMLLAVFTAGCYWLIRDRLQVSVEYPSVQEIYLSLALVWPLAMLLLLLVPERGIINRWGFVYTVAVGVLALAAPRLVNLVATLLPEQSDWLTVWPNEHFVIPVFMSFLFCIVILTGTIMLLWRNDETEVAIISTTATGMIVLGGLHLPFISLSMMTAVCLVQVSSILRSSYAMAYRDDLTGLLGRRALNERLKGLGPRFSLAMLDVDHFKKFNDAYGHDVGDEVLKMVASRISRVGAGGTAFRYGGEEFCIVFPRKTLEQCVDALEEVRESVANYHMTLRDRGVRPVQAKEGERKRGTMATKIRKGTVAVTVSLGLAERSEDQPTPEEVVKAADEQLYRAKQKGRNQLCY